MRLTRLLITILSLQLLSKRCSQKLTLGPPLWHHHLSSQRTVPISQMTRQQYSLLPSHHTLHMYLALLLQIPSTCLISRLPWGTVLFSTSHTLLSMVKGGVDQTAHFILTKSMSGLCSVCSHILHKTLRLLFLCKPSKHYLHLVNYPLDAGIQLWLVAVMVIPIQVHSIV